MDRRSLILGAGTSGLALIAGTVGWRVERKPDSALAPWSPERARSPDARLETFRHAILAPNPHNRQPWLIRLEGADAAAISCDLAKRLPATDPYDRQIVIGFGTFLEIARIAAAELGIRLEVEPFPEGRSSRTLDARPVARLRFVPDRSVPRDPLFAAITRRRTNRSVYDPAMPVSAAVVRRISEGPFSVDPAFLAALRAITINAMTTEQTTPTAWGESVTLMRIGADEVNAKPDGLSLTGPKIEALRLAGILDRAAMADPSSSAFRTGLYMEREICSSIPAALWIATPGNDRLDQLEAGRRYVRANLRATMAGLSMQPLSQSLQEYPEMAGNLARVHRILGAGNSRVQMLARMGYADTPPPSPRWPLEAHLTA